MNLTQLKEAVETHGGATLTTELNNAAINSGYMVSLAGYEFKTSLELLTSELLEEYKQIASNKGAFIGLWVDGHDLYIDISINIHDEKDALNLARNNKQLAIYHIETGKSIYV